MVVFRERASVERWQVIPMGGVDGCPPLLPIKYLRASVVQNKINKIKFVLIRFRKLYRILITNVTIIPVIPKRNIN